MLCSWWQNYEKKKKIQPKRNEKKFANTKTALCLTIERISACYSLSVEYFLNYL